VLLFAMNQLADQPFTPWLTGLGIQCLAGIALIAKGGDGRPWGIALIFGVVYMVVIVVSLAFLGLVVCLGMIITASKDK